MNIISHANGRTALEIAAVSGFSRQSVYEVLNRYVRDGLVTKRLIPGQKVTYVYYATEDGRSTNVRDVRKKPRIDASKVLKLYNKNKNPVRIAEKLGCSEKCVRNHLRKIKLSGLLQKAENTKSPEKKVVSIEGQLIALCDGKRTINDISSLSNLDYKVVGKTLNKAWKEKRIGLSWRGANKIYGPVSQHIPDDNLFGGLDVLALCDGKTTVKELAVQHNLNFTKLSNYLNWATVKGLLKVRSTPIGNFYYKV